MDENPRFYSDHSAKLRSLTPALFTTMTSELDTRIAACLGFLSLGCWIVVYSPQVYTIYVAKTGEGLSVLFLLIWLAGDLANLVGARWQGLLDTMVYVGLWYSLSDILLLGQMFYYSSMRRRYPGLYDNDPSHPNGDYHDEDTAESSALLGGQATKPKRSSFGKVVDFLWHHAEKIGVILSVCFVVALGVGSWVSSAQNPPNPPSKEKWDTSAQVAGWISCFLYLASRVPQIAKNVETKCEGLSMLFFIYALCGNITYVMSILIASIEPEHIWLNLSWLIGSAGTIFLDLVVLGQFYYYRKDRRIRKSVLDAGFATEPSGRPTDP